MQVVNSVAMLNKRRLYYSMPAFGFIVDRLGGVIAAKQWLGINWLIAFNRL